MSAAHSLSVVYWLLGKHPLPLTSHHLAPSIPLEAFAAFSTFGSLSFLEVLHLSSAKTSFVLTEAN